LPFRPEVPPSGFGYPLGGVSSPTHGSLFQLPTLMGFSLQGFIPTPRPNSGFPGSLRSCAFLSDRMAWHRHSSGFRSRDQRHPPALPPSSGKNGDRALLSFRTFQVFVRRTFGAVSSLSMSLPSFPSDLRRCWKLGPQGFPSAGSASPFFRRAPTCRVFSTDCPLPPLKNVNPSRPIFSARNSLNPHGFREAPPSDRSHPA